MKNEAPPHIAEQKNLLDREKGAFQKYRELYLGNRSFLFFLKYEIIITLFSAVPGAAGLLFRKLFFPLLFKKTGKGVVFGRNMTIRHPGKISIGNNVIFDDNTVLDAKGRNNHGITIGDNAVIGRNTIISCKGGDIRIGNFSNIGPNNSLFSESRLMIGRYVFTAGNTYMVAGGNHSYENRETPIYFQPSVSRGGIIIEDDIWIGASVTVIDGVSIGKGSVIGAASLVNQAIPPMSIAVGIPAKVIKSR